MVYRVIPNISGLPPFFMLYGSEPILPVNILLQPRLKYVGTQLHRWDLEQMDIVMYQAAKIFRKA